MFRRVSLTLACLCLAMAGPLAQSKPLPIRATFMAAVRAHMHRSHPADPASTASGSATCRSLLGKLSVGAMKVTEVRAWIPTTRPARH